MEGMLRSDAASPSTFGRKWVHVLLLISSSFQLLGMAASQVPSPGYYLGSKFSSVPFDQGFSYLWGPQHQSVSADKSSINLWLDKLSGSGFKSNQAYSSGYFGVSMKLPSGYSAGVVTCFYLSNNQAHPGDHDEVDFEFLGTVPGEPYILQTNLFAKGSGDGPRVIGREVRIRLWFDPTMDFHHYGILWNPDQLVFFVDDVPIRRYIHRSDTTFPARPMWVYGSIWDGSPWATDNGRYKVDYGRAPFTARYTRFILGGACPAFASCRPVAVSPSGQLSPQQEASLKWVQDHYTVYNYCWRAASASLTPECRS